MSTSVVQCRHDWIVPSLEHGHHLRIGPPSLSGPAMTDSTGANYEQTDIDPALVGWLALGLGLFVLATPLLMPFVFPQAVERRGPPARPALSSEAPSLALDPAEELRRQREQDRLFAESYGWVDRNHNIVRIPVARAMERLSQTGLPGWPSE